MKQKYPFYGWLGIILTAISWYLSWDLEGLRTHILFFPLWLGYILAIDGLVVMRRGHSLLTRSSKGFILLFVLSILFWWLFELVNSVLQNWQYLGREQFSDLEYALFASLNFSTVLPAVFESAELAGSFRLRFLNRPFIRTGKNLPIAFFISGWIMLGLFLTWPLLFFPFVWIFLYFILEPVNHWLGFKTLLPYTSKENWRPVWNLWLGALLCGFFWEMWNYYSYPKWIYQLPYLNEPKLFEMPLAGYLGYLPFSLELYALYNFMAGILRINSLRNFVQPE